MSSRKLISFGKNSYVISLPKSWIQRNNLKKGDNINIDESLDSLTIYSKNSSTPVENKIKKIYVDDTQRNIFRKIKLAYINNYNIVEIHGKNLENLIKKIRDTTQNLVAFEIMEQCQKKIIIKDFLNTQDISLDNIITRVDMIIRAMFNEIFEYIENKSPCDLETRDKDIDRLFYVGFKLLNKVLNNPKMSKKLNIEFVDVIYYWKLLVSFEVIGNQLKRIIRAIGVLDYDNIKKEKVIEIFRLLNSEYLKVIKLYHKHDKTIADNIIDNKKDIYDRCDQLISNIKNPCDDFNKVTDFILMVEKFKRIESMNCNIARALIAKDFFED